MAEKSFTYLGKLLANMINSIPIEFEDLKRFWGFEDELNQLRQSLLSIADLVEDAEQKQPTVAEAERWMRNLKEAAYDADILLSELAYETTRLQVHSFSSISRPINNVRKAKFHKQMLLKLKNVNQSLQNIQRDSIPVQYSSAPRISEDMLSWNRLPMDSILDDLVVGRKADVAKIVNHITSSTYKPFSVAYLIGRDGIGKTTLAELVCQKVMGLTRKPFDVKIWLNISKTFTAHKILEQMLRSLNSSMWGLTSEDAIVQQLKKELASKTFLLVLDDVWHSSDRLQWRLLVTMLFRICTNHGNAILVTAISEDVSYSMGTSTEHTFKLSLLSKEECWFILKERAFRNVITPVPSNLEAIGREIAIKCGGIPLIANVLGVLMGFNNEEEAWLKIRDFDDFKENPLPLIKQIFYNFPSYLKSCIAFCSFFPRSFVTRKEELISLWMAEGIVESCDMGNKCFDALLASSVLQEVERDDYDDIILCKMHNLVFKLLDNICISDIFSEYKEYLGIGSSNYHLYADDYYIPGVRNILKRRASKWRTIIVSGAPNQEIWKIKGLRSLHLNAADMDLLPSSIGKMKHLRYLGVSISKTKELSRSITKLYNLQTLNLSNSSIKEFPEFITKLFNLQTLNLSNSNIKVLPESICKLRSIQTLNVSNSNIEELPESITKLHSLQALDVSNSNIKELPESITHLCNLQTLKFVECKELTKLPRKKINNMISLKHIAFSYEHQMPFGLGKLNGLETLLFFVVGPDCGGCIEELRWLNELRGDLKITRLEKVSDKKEVERANLQGKANLQGLGFIWSYEENDRSSRDE